MDIIAHDDTQLVTFDCYGTLIDWDTALRGYFEPLLAEKGVDIPVREFYDIWYHAHALPALGGPFVPYRTLLQTSLQSALTAAGAPAEPGDGADLGDAMAAAEPFPEASEVLARLKERYRLGTISNSQHDIISAATQRLGNPFDFVFTGEDTRTYKPHPALFELVLNQAGVLPTQVVHVAQSQYVDLPRSIPMGIPTIWVNRNHQQLRAEVPAPTAVIDDLTPLPELLGVAAART